MSFDLDPVLNFRAGKLELITLFFATPTLFFLTSKFKYKWDYFTIHCPAVCVRVQKLLTLS